MLKTQSIAGKSKDLIENTKIKLNERFEKVEIININKWAKGHSAYYVE